MHLKRLTSVIISTMALPAACGTSQSASDDTATAADLASTPDTPDDATTANDTAPTDTTTTDISGIPPIPTDSARAFPGAEGFGANATGGRGGRVITVTSLATSGPGSLQDALDQEGPRTIVFAVGGLIDGGVHLTRGDVTIAGQTAPGGITIRQFHTTEEPYCDQNINCVDGAARATNWILRHVRIRPDANARFDDGLRLRYTRNAIVDHVSIANASDEAVEISYSNDITIQNTILAETVGDHARFGGMLLNYSNPAKGHELDRISMHHNVWHRLGGRFPEVSCESAACANHVMRLDLTNNLLWDQSYFIDINNTTISASDEGRPFWMALNWVGNLSHARGPGSNDPYPYGVIHIAEPRGTAPETSVYMQGNRSALYPDRADWDLRYCCNDYPTGFEPGNPPPAWARNERHPFPPITTHAATDLPAYAVERIGAFPRDPLDQRLFGAIATNRVDPTARDRNPAGDGSALPAGTPPAAPVDTDGDGMPDTWETAKGLDPATPDGNLTTLSRQTFGVDFYTNLEVWLHEASEAVIRAGR
jgi:hypothetical protein